MYDKNSHIYQQIDGVSMGTPIGPTFAKFYASHLEETVFKNDPSLEPPVYCRYMEENFMVIIEFHQLNRLKDEFAKKNSILNFTFEFEFKKEMPSLHTLTTRTNQWLMITHYTKDTYSGDCLNYKKHLPGTKLNISHQRLSAPRVCCLLKLGVVQCRKKSDSPNVSE